MARQQPTKRATTKRASKRSAKRTARSPLDDLVTPTARPCPPAPPSLADRLAQEEYECAVEVEHVLEGWEESAEDTLQMLVRVADEAENPEDRRARQKQIADETIKGIRLLRRSIERGQIWTAVRYAIWAGMFGGFDQAFPYQFAADRTIRLQAPDVKRGRKVMDGARAGGCEGGRAPKGPDAKQLQREVSERHHQQPYRSWTWVSGEVAKEHGLHAITVRRKTRELRWPMP